MGTPQGLTASAIAWTLEFGGRERPGNARTMSTRFVIEPDVLAARDRGEAMVLEDGMQMTHAAADAAKLYDVTVVPADARHRHDWRPPAGHSVRVAIGCDHGGFPMKRDLLPVLQAAGCEVIDCGTDSEEAVDYPDFALAVARAVAAGRAHCGIVVDGAGIGSCMVANKVPGVLAANCHTIATARNSREHNNANVLTLGGKMLEPALAAEVVRAWLQTPFGGGRHQRRVDKIVAVETRHLRPGAVRS